MKHLIKKYLLKNFSVKNLIVMVLGVVLIGAGSGIFRVADLGVDPFSCTVKGIAAVTGIQFGNVQLMYNILLLIFVIAGCRESLGLGTIVNMAGVGYVSDLVFWLVNDGIKYSPNLVMRFVLLLVFLVVFGLGIALYMETDMGTAPYDTLGEIIDHATKGRLPFKYARVILDVISVLIGILLGTVIEHETVFGIGTILLAVGTGLIAGTFRKFIRNRRSRKNSEE